MDGYESEPITIVGTIPNPKKGARLQIEGDWTTNAKYGVQFKVKAFTYVRPDTRDGLVAYLGSGLLKGVGPALAEKIVTALGDRTVSVLDSSPEELLLIPGIGEKKLDQITTEWKAHRDMSEAVVFLQSLGVSSMMAVRIYRKYQDVTIPTVKANPYGLAEDIWGIGFTTADRIAETLGVPRDSKDRLSAGVLHVLQARASNGQMCLPRRFLVDEAAELLAADPRAVDQALGWMIQGGKCRSDRFARANDPGQEEYIYLKGLYQDEVRLVSQLRRLCESAESALQDVPEEYIQRMIDANELKLTDEQARAVRTAFRAKVSLLTGGPGCGKTFLTRVLVRAAKGARRAVLLVSPTGRAAKRLSSATESDASTIHRALGFSPDGDGFLHNENNPLAGDLVIIDEASMLDTSLAYSLLRAIKTPSHVVFVGDPDQLPSVGPGNVLKDLIRSQVFPVTHLKEVKRQTEGSTIITNAHRINRGELPVLSQTVGDFFFLQVEDPDKLAKVVSRIVTQWLPENFGFDPLMDIQVLAPMRAGRAGILALNEVLRDAINPQGKPEDTVKIGNASFRKFDKVMQVRNNYKLQRLNGDYGLITDGSTEKTVL